MTEARPDWLIRETTNIIRGPYTHGEVLQLIKKGQVKGKVELCRSNAYWFSLEESNEVERFFPEVTSDTKKLHQEPTGTVTNATALAPEVEEPTQIISTIPDTKPMGAVVASPRKKAPAAPKQIAKKAKAKFDSKWDSKFNFALTPKIKSILTVVGLAVLGVGFYMIMSIEEPPKKPMKPGEAKKAQLQKPTKLPLSQQALRAFLLRDTDEVKRTLSKLEKDSAGATNVGVAQAIYKRWYLFDLDGAISTLEAASQKTDAADRAKVENLMGVLLSERDLPRAAIHFTTALQAGSKIAVYNFVNVQIRAGNIPLADAMLREWEKRAKPDLIFYSDLTLMALWSADKKSQGPSSTIYKMQIRDQFDARFRAIRGLIDLRRNQVPEAEEEFRAFVELLPELEVGTLKDTRKVSDEAFYEYVWKQVQQLHGQTTSQNSRLSPAIAAGVGILTAIQNRAAEANGILTNALKAAPGDPTLLKALAYLRWREGRYREILDLVQSLPVDSQNDFAVIYLLAKTNLRLGNPPKAEGYFAQVVKRLPTRADGWSGYGESLLAQNKVGLAAPAFENAFKLDRLDPGVLRGFDQLHDWSFLETPEYKEMFPFY
jgi:predicted Zn-dependent protease